MSLEGLGAAVVMQALKDAAAGDAEALAWLAGPDGSFWWELSGRAEQPNREAIETLVSCWETRLAMANQQVTAERLAELEQAQLHSAKRLKKGREKDRTNLLFEPLYQFERI